MSLSAAQQVITSINPATGEVIWEGEPNDNGSILNVVKQVAKAQAKWGMIPVEERIQLLQRFARLTNERLSELASLISQETGKPYWESNAEAKLIASKVDASIKAFAERMVDRHVDMSGRRGRTRHIPLGVVAVLGPFNFPAHLPNGHIVPALLAGNGIIFKPSEYTPATGTLLVELIHEAGIPEDVVQIVQGGPEIGKAIVDAPIDGLLFTGSSATGRAIHRSLAGRPEVLLALEMGGNNPLVVHDCCDLVSAAEQAVISAYITSGQRCTCARRLILPEGSEGDELIERISLLIDRLIVGVPTDRPEPFMGTLIHQAAADQVLQAQSRLITRGADILRACKNVGDVPALLSPGLIDVTNAQSFEDEEIFGPLLQVIRVPDFNAAIQQANATQFGLAASLFSDHRDYFETFQNTVRAGVINWNQPTTGASGLLPFGGLVGSGNHRPSGFYAADYCADATASVESDRLSSSGGLPGMPREGQGDKP